MRISSSRKVTKRERERAAAAREELRLQIEASLMDNGTVPRADTTEVFRLASEPLGNLSVKPFTTLLA